MEIDDEHRLLHVFFSFSSEWMNQTGRELYSQVDIIRIPDVDMEYR